MDLLTKIGFVALLTVHVVGTATPGVAREDSTGTDDPLASGLEEEKRAHLIVTFIQRSWHSIMKSRLEQRLLDQKL